MSAHAGTGHSYAIHGSVGFAPDDGRSMLVASIPKAAVHFVCSRRSAIVIPAGDRMRCSKKREMVCPRIMRKWLA